MSSPSEANRIDFKWGNKRGVGLKNKDTQFYESFIYRGVEYILYDCVYFHHNGDLETSVGKLVKIYEMPTHEKMVKVVWFLRPGDIRYFLGDYQPHWKELFLASGEGKGVSNVNYLEEIIGKCRVICTSKDKRNPAPSEAELKMADFLFNRAFDVGRLVIVDKLAEEIGGIKVEHFFNRKKGTDIHVGTDMKESNGRSGLSSKLNQLVGKVNDGKHNCGLEESNKAKVNLGEKVHLSNNISISRPKITIKRSGMSHCPDGDKADGKSSEAVSPENTLHSFPYKKRKIMEQKLSIGPTLEKDFDEMKSKARNEVAPQVGLVEVVKTCGKTTEVAERPDAEKRRWFKSMPWEERLRKAQENGTLVLLNNLDPSYTSYDVEDLVWHIFKEKVEARMIEWTATFNPYYGRALVIFKKKDAAESAISQLNERCLILADGRTVSGLKGTLTEVGNQANFIGHLTLDRFGLQKQSEDKKNAVSTSHCSQANTIEYGMALEWVALQKNSDAWWNALYEKQRKEIQDVKSKAQNSVTG